MILNRPESVDEKRLSSIVYNEDINISEIIEENTNNTISNGKKRRVLLSDFGTIDTETTTIRDCSVNNPFDFPISVTYLYQITLFDYNFIFRTSDDFSSFLNTIVVELNKHNATLVFYVHNLSFEFQFFKAFLNIDSDSVFATKPRSIIKFTTDDGALEFRCSYYLSNMSLEKFTENFCDETYRKDKDLIDYEIERFPWTELSDEELYYSLMDTITLYHAIKNIMEKDGDNIKTIPVTSTGYPRRDGRIACIGKSSYHRTDEQQKYVKLFHKVRIDKHMMELAEKAFRGGNTHANRFYANQHLYNIGSYDFSSSYPAIIVASDYFAMSKPVECTKDVQDLDSLKYYANKYWMILRILFKDIEVRDYKKVVCPYISKSNVLYDRKEDGIYDNGRILKQNGYVEITCLGNELPIIMGQYKGSFKVIEAYYSHKGYLPDLLRKTVLNYFHTKTELKGVQGKEYEYMKSKNKLNSFYGMMVEKMVKPIIEYSLGKCIMRQPTEEEIEDAIAKFYSNRSNKYLCFLWGVSITAVARVRLQEMIDIVGSDFVYCDTDSCKMRSPEKYIKKFDKYNEEWIKKADNCGLQYYAYTKNNEKQILGIADRESDYKEFITLGAKKYAVINKKNVLEITIAGVPKKAGALLLGNIDNFKPGFVFKTSDSDSNSLRQLWKKTLFYNDDINEVLTIDGRQLNITSYVALERTTYELNITDEYQDLIKENYLNTLMVQDDVYFN